MGDPVRLAPFGGVSFMLAWVLIALEHGTRKGGVET